MRTRSRSTQLGGANARFKLTRNGNSVVDASRLTFWNKNETMQDRVNPGFFRAQREGNLMPVAPMVKTKSDWLLEPGQVTATRITPNGNRPPNVQVLNATGCFTPNSIITMSAAVPPWPTVDTDLLLQSALARAQTDAWDVGTFLAEFGKTVESMTTFYGRWKVFYEKLLRAARGKRRLFHTFADAFTSAWLEARYSFRPLYYDMLSIRESIRRLQEGELSPLCRGWATEESSPSGRGMVVPSSSFGSYTLQGNGLVSVSSVSSGDNFRTNHYRNHTRVIKARATVGVQVTTRDITLVDPVLTAWELVPFSFVLDWFISVGDMLTAFSPFATGHFRYATLSIEQIDTIEVTSVGVFAGETSGGGTPSRISRITSTYQRSLTSVAPSLGFQVNLNKSKIFDLLALAFQMKLRHSNLLKNLR